MARIYNHPPANLALLRSVLVMILRWELSSFFSDDLSPTSRATINARMRRRLTGPVDRVEGRILTFCEVLVVLVQGHDQNLGEQKWVVGPKHDSERRPGAIEEKNKADATSDS